jgi:hypothetical protein
MFNMAMLQYIPLSKSSIDEMEEQLCLRDMYDIHIFTRRALYSYLKMTCGWLRVKGDGPSV